jgi:pimeloyl-ACP methyl ester carboxylesterase
MMIARADCRKDRGFAERRAFRLGRRCGGVFFACLLTLVAFCRVDSAVADGRVVGFLVRHSQRLVTETETPEDFQQIAAKSAYPPTDPPQKLTSEQLDAIAKLAPRSNQAGVKVHPAMVPLFRSMVLRYTGGTYKDTPLRFRLHVPESLEPGKTYPLVVWLHGAGECGSDNINQLSHLHHIIPYLVGPKKRDFFLLVPQCPHTHVSWEAPEICSSTVRGDGSVECHVVDDPVARGNAPIAFTLAMTDAVMKRFPIDRNRVSVAGLSTGGEGVWRIVERRPDLFAAAVPLVSWHTMQEKSLREHPILKKIPIWAIYSSDDTAIDFARKDFERMRQRGCNVRKTEFGVCGHRAWTPAMLQGDIFGWLISRAKDGDRYYPAQSSPTSPDTVGIFADVTEGDLKRQPTKATRARPAVAANPPIWQALPAAPSSAFAYQADPTRRPQVLLYPTKSPAAEVESLRLTLIDRYVVAGAIKEALAVADKVKNRQELVKALLQADAEKIKILRDYMGSSNPQAFSYPDRDVLLAYIDREIDRLEQHGATSATNGDFHFDGTVDGTGRTLTLQARSAPVAEAPLSPIPAGKKSPKDECGKEWTMSTDTLYGLFPSGWDQEAARLPAYIVNETGNQLRDRLAKAFADDDLAAMKEFCGSFIRLDDIPLSSPWFDTSGGRLKGRIKYTLNEKARPVVALLRDIAQVRAESKQAFVELAQKSLKRIDAITHPKTE